MGKAYAKYKFIFPSGITFLNWLSGLLAIILSIEGLYIEASLCIIAAALFDFFDGFLARAINAVSEFGKHLDAFADALSFGIAPSFLMYSFLKSNDHFSTAVYVILFIPAGAALIRLAIFSSFKFKERDFTGMAAPANGLFIAGLFLIIELKEYKWLETIINSEYTWMIIPLSLSVFMLLPLKMFSLKIKSIEWEANKFSWIFLTIAAAIIIVFSINSLPLVIILYLIMSVIYHFTNYKTKNQEI